MKFQYILNDKVLFETNDFLEYITYLYALDDHGQAKHSVLYRLLEKSGGHICEMVNADYKQ